MSVYIDACFREPAPPVVPTPHAAVSELGRPLDAPAWQAWGGPRNAHLRPRSGATVAARASAARQRPQQQRSSAAAQSAAMATKMSTTFAQVPPAAMGGSTAGPKGARGAAAAARGAAGARQAGARLARC